MMRKLFFSSLLIAILFAGFTACSNDGVPCGGSICGSGEVCESGECVLGIFIDGGEADTVECQGDADCSRGKVCTDLHSNPANTCIPLLNCEMDSHCQSGLQCGPEGFCR